MGKERQLIYIDSNIPTITAKVLIGSDSKYKELADMFSEAKSVYIRIPVGEIVDIADVDGDAGSVVLEVISAKRMPSVCIYDEKNDRKWCNYKIFRSGKDPNELKKILNNLSNAIDILVQASPAAKESLERIVTAINIVEDIDQSEFGYSAAAYTTYHKSAPTCEITVSEKWVKDESPMLVARMLSHELGHCQEAYHRRIRYLGPKEGDWVEKGGKVIPVGTERVAEHFSLRTMKRAASRR